MGHEVKAAVENRAEDLNRYADDNLVDNNYYLLLRCCPDLGWWLWGLPHTQEFNSKE